MRSRTVGERLMHRANAPTRLKSRPAATNLLIKLSNRCQDDCCIFIESMSLISLICVVAEICQSAFETLVVEDLVTCEATLLPLTR